MKDKCSRCGKKAVVYVGLNDPDGTRYPMCRKCANKWRIEILMAIYEPQKTEFPFVDRLQEKTEPQA